MLFSIIPIPTELTITASLLSGKDCGLIALDTGFSGNKFLKILFKKPRKKYGLKFAIVMMPGKVF